MTNEFALVSLHQMLSESQECISNGAIYHVFCRPSFMLVLVVEV